MRKNVWSLKENIRNIKPKKFILNEQTIIPLGTKMQSGSLTVILDNRAIWKREPFFKKLKMLVNKKTIPSENVVQALAYNLFMEDYFGTINDYGEMLYELNKQHNSIEWDFKYLTDADRKKAESIDALIILELSRHSETSDLLNLNLAQKNIITCTLATPMFIKIPIVSMQYFLIIHNMFAFNEIRKAGHTQANGIIAYLYELSVLQCKIGATLHTFLKLINLTNQNKEHNLITIYELDAIRQADLLFIYLKASIEKIMVLTGLVFNIIDLEAKKTHKQKIKKLEDEIPNGIKEAWYHDLFMEYISSKSLERLNSYRTGILHKKGISKLQPNEYFGKNADTLPLIDIYQVLYEEHTNNSFAFLFALAMLTDELVKLVPPDDNIIHIFPSDEYISQFIDNNYNVHPKLLNMIDEMNKIKENGEKIEKKTEHQGNNNIRKDNQETNQSTKSKPK